MFPIQLNWVTDPVQNVFVLRLPIDILCKVWSVTEGIDFWWHNKLEIFVWLISQIQFNHKSVRLVPPDNPNATDVTTQMQINLTVTTAVTDSSTDSPVTSAATSDKTPGTQRKLWFWLKYNFGFSGRTFSVGLWDWGRVTEPRIAWIAERLPLYSCNSYQGHT